MPVVEHLSYSSISSYLSCPWAWKLHYLDKVQTPTATALVFGGAFHNTIEERIKTGVPLLDTWREKWTAQVAQAGEIDWGSDTKESLENEGIRLLSNEGVAGLVDSLHASEIERYVELRVPNVEVPVIGYIDIITEDGVPGDFKTSARSWTADKAQAEMQPVFYLAALNQDMYTGNPDLLFRHYVFVKTKTPQVQVLEHQHEPRELFWLFGMIQKVWWAIKAGAFPQNPTGWKCSPQYCEYWSMCRGK